MPSAGKAGGNVERVPAEAGGNNKKLGGNAEIYKKTVAKIVNTIHIENVFEPNC